MDLNVFGIVHKCLEKTNICNKNMEKTEDFVFTISISKILSLCRGPSIHTDKMDTCGLNYTVRLMIELMQEQEDASICSVNTFHLGNCL